MQDTDVIPARCHQDYLTIFPRLSSFGFPGYVKALQRFSLSRFIHQRFVPLDTNYHKTWLCWSHYSAYIHRNRDFRSVWPTNGIKQGLPRAWRGNTPWYAPERSSKYTDSADDSITARADREREKERKKERERALKKYNGKRKKGWKIKSLF